jgi:hypothetical protein
MAILLTFVVTLSPILFGMAVSLLLLGIVQFIVIVASFPLVITFVVVSFELLFFVFLLSPTLSHFSSIVFLFSV